MDLRITLLAFDRYVPCGRTKMVGLRITMLTCDRYVPCGRTEMVDLRITLLGCDRYGPCGRTEMVDLRITLLGCDRVQSETAVNQHGRVARPNAGTSRSLLAPPGPVPGPSHSLPPLISNHPGHHICTPTPARPERQPPPGCGFRKF